MLKPFCLTIKNWCKDTHILLKSLYLIFGSYYLYRRFLFNSFNDLFIRSIRQDFFQMLENPLIRLFGSTVALASLFAIEIFGSVEQRPTPAIFVIVLVTRIDEIFGHDVSRHFQSGEITVKLASHSLARKTAGCPKFPCNETAGRLKCTENGSFYRFFIRARKLASSVVAEVRPPFLANESCFLVEELSVYTRHFLNNLSFDFVELAHARQSSSKLGFALA